MKIYEYAESIKKNREGELEKLESLVQDYYLVLGKLTKTNVKGSMPPRAVDVEVNYLRLVEHVQQLQAQIDAKVADDPGLREKLQEKNNTSFAASEADRALRAYRGDFQAAKFNFEESKKHVLADGPTESAVAKVRELSVAFNKNSVKVLNDKLFKLEKTGLAADEAEVAYDAVLKEKTSVAGAGGATDYSALTTGLKNSLLAVNHALKQYQLIDSSMRNAVRNAPLLDFMAPSYKIDKVVTPGLKEPLNFMDVDRVHRCKTCHINIDDPDPRFVGYQDEKWGSVYASHPRLDLFLSAASSHTYQETGCTTCHYGDGHATEFTIAAHTPAGEEQRKEWEGKYHWHLKHHEEHPMLPAGFTSSSCTKCHNDQWEIEGADRLNLGKKLVRTYGCFGCHTIEGFEVAAGASDDRVWKLNKVGPNLKHLGDKVSMGFLTRWIRNPGHFRESSKMPRFFDLTNSNGKMLRPLGSVDDESGGSEEVDFNLRNSVEVLGLATYLFNTSIGAPGAGTASGGDPVRGRELVKTLGCMGCHSIKVESEGEYDEPLPALAAVLAALEQKAAQSAEGQPLLAAAYRESGAKLSDLYGWLKGLDVGSELEELYSMSKRAIEKSMALEESLEIEESAMESAGQLADAVYNRWIHNTFGPDLSPLARTFDLATERGRKKAVSWLSSWILNPQAHDPETVMPRFRLAPGQDPAGEQKVADMVSYLLTLDYNDVDLAAHPSASPATLGESQKKDRDEGWESGLVTTNAAEIESDPAKKKILDDIATYYLSAAHGTNRAAALLKGGDVSKPMTTSEKLNLVGHRLVRRYGCFGCHNGIR
ncbi:MAG: c-type cytochrome, partial [Planctomycetes bacterium]|nr:c-type cytochrome [Planctomycetota bacterium]